MMFNVKVLTCGGWGVWSVLPYDDALRLQQLIEYVYGIPARLVPVIVG